MDLILVALLTLFYVSPPFLLAFLALMGAIEWWGYIPMAVWLALVTIFGRDGKTLGEASRTFIDSLLAWGDKEAWIGATMLFPLSCFPVLLYWGITEGPDPSLARTAFMACICLYIVMACGVVASMWEDYSNDYSSFEAHLAVFGFLTPPGVIVGLVLIWRWGAFGAWWDWLIGHFTG
jgi:hypothetical protein